MAEPRNDEAPRRYDDTTDPRFPPNSVLNKSARRAAVWSYLAPIVVLFVVIGGALVYWSGRPANSQPKPDARTETGTFGRTDGSLDAPQLDSARDEITFRGADLAPITSVSELHGVDPRVMTGRRVQIDDARLESVSGNVLWVRDDDRKYAIVAPAGAPSMKPGTRVSVTGRVGPDDQGQPQIVADRVQEK
jgi:hypothetical protein